VTKFAFFCLFYFLHLTAYGQITLIVPYGAGGATDHLARSTAQKIETETGINLVIVNKPGASSNIGFSTFLECQQNCLLIAGPNIKTNAKYVPESYPKEIGKIPPLVFLTETPQILYVRSSLNIDSFVDFRKKIKTLTFGHGGKGTQGYRSYEKICVYFECQEISYKSGSSAIIDLLGQRIDAISIPAYGSEVISQNHAIPILVLGKKRVNSLSVPSAKELGYEDLIIESWWMLFERNLNSEYKKKLLTLFKTDIDIIRLWNN
jgi:tripartite-type tricarboxylate transporter receptor subunit TctC